MLQIRNFTSENIPDALRLCAQAGWNHIAADWQRTLDLLPEACLGGFDADGTMRATCTLTRFGRVGWAGTFLVDESLRGRGEGKAIFHAFLAKAAELGIETIGIDSSDAGRPIYLKSDFVMTEQGVELWAGPSMPIAPGGTERLNDSHWDDLLSLDRDSVKVDRSGQLRHLANEQGAAGRVVGDGGRLQGFGFARPGKVAGVIGPVVARSLAVAQKLIAALADDRRSIDGDKPISMAVLDQTPLKQWLTSQGLAMRRRNIRMFRPAARPVLSGRAVFVATALGMG